MMYYMFGICIYVCVGTREVCIVSNSVILIYTLREVHMQRVKRERNGMDSEKVEGIEKMGRKKEGREGTERKLCLDNAHLGKPG